MIGFGLRMDGYELRLVEMERRTSLGSKALAIACWPPCTKVSAACAWI